MKVRDAKFYSITFDEITDITRISYMTMQEMCWRIFYPLRKIVCMDITVEQVLSGNESSSKLSYHCD